MISSEKRNAIVDLYHRNYTVNDTASELDVSIATVRRVLERNGLLIRKYRSIRRSDLLQLEKHLRTTQQLISKVINDEV